MRALLRALTSGILALSGPALVIVPLELMHDTDRAPEPAPTARPIALGGGEPTRTVERSAQRRSTQPAPPAVPEVQPVLPAPPTPELRLPPLEVALDLPPIEAPRVQQRGGALPGRPPAPSRDASDVADAGKADHGASEAAVHGPMHEDGVDQPPRPMPGNLAPAYPAAARRRGETGAVRVRIVIDEQGRVCDVREAERSGPPVLFEAVRDAVSGWRFQPARDGGRPISVYALKSFRFHLSGR